MSSSSAPELSADQPRGATMQTIAEWLNLSTATVSRALRRIPGINPATRVLGVRTAARIGCHLPKSHRAEPLDNRQLDHLGVLIEMPTTYLPPDGYVAGMSDAAMTLNASPVGG